MSKHIGQKIKVTGFWQVKKQIIAWVTLSAFLLTTLGNGVAAAVGAAPAIAKIPGSLFTLPYSLGRVSDGYVSGQDVLVIYINDLHCTPEAQQHIFQIIHALDKQFGVKRIFVEGAARGKVQPGLLEQLARTKANGTAFQALLDRGILSGVQYYEALYGNDKLYGIEDWNAYRRNLGRAQRLIAAKKHNIAVADTLAHSIDRLAEKYASHHFEHIVRRFYREAGKAGSAQDHLLFLRRLAKASEWNSDEYPNLARQITLLQLASAISERQVAAELRGYVRDLGKAVPYGVYENLLQQRNNEGNSDAFLQSLSEAGAVYAPYLSAKYPQAARFLEQERLQRSIDPALLLNEEAALIRFVLSGRTGNLADHEMLVLQELARLFVGYVELQITPQELAFFSAQKEIFRNQLIRYFNAQEIGEALALLDDTELASYHEENLRRNEYFVASIIAQAGASGRNTAAPEDGASAVLARMKGFREINVVVAGGFHAGITRSLRAHGISFLSIIPRVTGKSGETLYDTLILGNYDAPAASDRSTLAPPYDLPAQGRKDNDPVIAGVQERIEEKVTEVIEGEQHSQPEEQGNIRIQLLTEFSLVESWLLKQVEQTLSAVAALFGEAPLDLFSRWSDAFHTAHSGYKPRPGIENARADQFQHHLQAIADAYSELLRAAEVAVQNHSNVHRGSGHYSQASTHLFELSRDLLLDYLVQDKGPQHIDEASKDQYVILFGERLHTDALFGQLTPRGQERSRLLSLNEWGLPFGICALAVHKEDLPSGAPLNSGGGTVTLVGKNEVLWGDFPDRAEAGTPNILAAILFAKAAQIINAYRQERPEGSYANIFRAADEYPELKGLFHRQLSLDALYQDDPEDELPASGQALLERLRHLRVGDISVPTEDGVKDSILFDNGASTQLFSPQLRVLQRVLRLDPALYSGLVEEARGYIARFLGAPADRYATFFAPNTTGGTNIIADNLARSTAQDAERPIILSTEVEHHSNFLPFQYSHIPGATVKLLPIDDHGFVDRAALERLLRASNSGPVKRIKLVTVTGLSNVLGTLNDAHALAELVHQYGATLLVDGAQVPAHIPFQLEETDPALTPERRAARSIDYFVTSGHKMHAAGSGVVIIRKSLLALHDDEVSRIRASGEANIAGIATLRKSVELFDRIGMEVVRSSERDLTAYALQRLREVKRNIPDLEIYGIQNPEDVDGKGGVIVFGIRGIPANYVGKRLAELGGIAVRPGSFCAHILVQKLTGTPWFIKSFLHYALRRWPTAQWIPALLPGLVRISFSIENSPEEIDVLVATLYRIAAERSQLSWRDRAIGWFRGTAPTLPLTAGNGIMEQFVDTIVGLVYRIRIKARPELERQVCGQRPEGVTEYAAIDAPAVPAADVNRLAVPQAARHDGPSRSVTEVAGAAVREAVKPGTAIAGVSLQSVRRSRASRNRHLAAIAATGSIGIVAAGSKEWPRALSAARSRARAGVRTILVGEQSARPEGIASGINTRLAIDVPDAAGATRRIVVNISLAPIEEQGNLLQLFFEQAGDRSIDGQDVIAGTVDALARELNNEGVLRQLFDELHFGGAVWLIENSSDEAIARLQSLAAAKGEVAGKPIVHGRWDGAGRQLINYLDDQAVRYAGEADPAGDATAVTAEGHVSRARVALHVESPVALPGRGTISGIVKYAKNKEIFSRFIIGLEHGGFDVLSIEWESVIASLLKERRISRQLAEDLNREVSTIRKGYPEGSIDQGALQHLHKDFLRIAAALYAVEHQNLRNIGTVNEALAHVKPGDTGVSSFVQVLGLRQLSAAQKALRHNGQALLIDPGAEWNETDLKNGLPALLANAGGIWLDLEKYQGDPTALLQSIARTVEEGILSHAIPRDTIIRVRADQSLHGLIRSLGFQYEAGAPGSVPQLHELVAQGAVIEYDVDATQAVLDLQTVLLSGAAEIEIRTGHVAEDGTIARIRNVRPGEGGFLDVISLIRSLIGSSRAITPEALYAGGKHTGIAIAAASKIDAAILLDAGRQRLGAGIWRILNSIDDGLRERQQALAVVDAVEKHIREIALDERAQARIADVLSGIRRRSAAAGNENASALWELRGLLHGLIEQSLVSRLRVVGEHSAAPADRERLFGILADISRNIEYREGRPFVRSGLDLSARIALFPGLALILTPAERSALAGNLAGEIRRAGNVRNWLEFAEAIARSRDQDLRRTYVSEVARALEPIALETKAEAIVDNEYLAWWANAEALTEGRIHIGAIETLAQRLALGAEADDQALFVVQTLSVSEIVAGAFGTRESRLRAINARRSDPRYLYAARAFWLKETVAHAKAESAIDGYVDVFARIPVTASALNETPPETLVVTAHLLLERLARQEEMVITGFRTGSQEAVREMLSAA